MKKYVILLALLIGCSGAGGGSGGNVPPPVNPCGLDGYEVVWWMDLDGTLNFQNQSVTTYHQADDYGPERFIIEWYCSADYSVDADLHKFILEFQNNGGWAWIDTQVLEPECQCGG